MTRFTPRFVDQLTEAFNVVLPLTLPADTALRVFFRNNQQLGQRERATIAEAVYASLRRKRLLDTLLGAATPRQYALGALVKLRGVSVRELEPALRAQDVAFLKELKARSDPPPSIELETEFPDWLIAKLRATWPDAEIIELARALQQPAPLDLRVNSLLATREEVLREFAATGIEAEATPYSPFGVRLKTKPAINKHPLYLSGKVEVQDEGSQLLALLVAPKRGETVVDFCAGAGGKTLMLGALMRSQGQIFALDVDAKRLQQLHPRLARSQLTNVQPMHIDSERDAKLKRLRGKADRVLIDAPCSGLGTLRRNPDMKWRQRPEDIEELKAKQAAILESAAALVRPGGRLVYATCSFLAEENEDIVRAWQAKNPQFRPIPAGDILSHLESIRLTDVYLRVFPTTHETDGFFAAAYERSGESP
jgi:16S rRNA (cytosine967-C5)-methyltransferase